MTEEVTCTDCGTVSTVEFDSKGHRLTILDCCDVRRRLEYYRLQRNAARGTAKLLVEFAAELLPHVPEHITDRYDYCNDLDAFRRQVANW